MIRDIELLDDTMSYQTEEERMADGLDPSTVESVQGLPPFEAIAGIMDSKDSYMQYLKTTFGEEIDSFIEFKVALSNGEIDRDAFEELVQDIDDPQISGPGREILYDLIN